MSVWSLIREGVDLFDNKKFDEAIEKLNQALDEIKDKDSQIKEQNYIQFYLGCCYFEQALKAKGKESEQLFGNAVEHHQQQLRLAEQLADKQNSLQKQIDAQFGLGRCYFEQALKAKGKESKQLFGNAVEHYQQQLRLAEQLEDKQNSLQEQNNAQFGLGNCYLEQAKKVKGKESEQLFGNAVEHHQQQLRLAEQLEDKQNSLQEQIYAQSWLGRCYLEQAMKAKGKESEKLLGQAFEHFKQQLKLAEQLEDENGIQKQINAQHWLGCCYFEQAKKAEGKASEQLFGQAVEHYQQQLSLAEQLKDKQNSVQEQNNAEGWLGRCYLEQAIAIKDKKTSQAKKFSKRAEGYFLSAAKRLSQLIDKSEREKLKKRINELLRNSYFLQEEKWQSYFDQKKQSIREKLFKNKKDGLTDAISTILAVLNVPPIELGAIPLAHYTSPSVCERLFGIVSDKTNDKADNNDPVDSNKVSPMRIGSSTYMNDPTEGEGLLELLNLQDLELENKADCPVHNAFFTCLSSRVNDLNQFRLYGKENGVEASGCCLVFNKEGNWLKESDVSASFRSMVKKGGDGYSGEQLVEADIPNSDFEDDNLPLYQVAYIAYYDEYIAKEKCIIWLPNEENPKFGIRLKSVGKNLSWHEFRIGKLKKALEDLIEKSNNISDEDKKALEYIRYLFKDFAFRDEEEFRLLKIEQIGSKDIKYCQDTKSVYLPYADIRDIVDEVILGTNYEKSGKERKAEAFQHLMRKHYPKVKVSRSSLPINANPPIKKD